MKQGSRSRRWVVPLVVLVVAIPAFRYCQPPQRSIPLSADRPNIPTHAELHAARSGQALAYSEHGLDLVFEGGGAKGLAHVGAIREFEQRGLRSAADVQVQDVKVLDKGAGGGGRKELDVKVPSV